MTLDFDKDNIDQHVLSADTSTLVLLLLEKNNEYSNKNEPLNIFNEINFTIDFSRLLHIHLQTSFFNFLQNSMTSWYVNYICNLSIYKSITNSRMGSILTAS